MKRHLTILLLSVLTTLLSAQTVAPADSLTTAQADSLTAADIFRQLPDSLTPYLSQNNRLDMLDFMSANMKAEVTNQLDGKSEMTLLSPDSLSVRLSDVLTLGIGCGGTGEASGWVRLHYVYTLSPEQSEHVTAIYDRRWQLLSRRVVSSSLLHNNLPM